VALCLVLALAATGCTSDHSGSAANGADEPAAPADTLVTGKSMTLDVLVYNIEYGGNASTDKVIRSVDADVVGVLESYNRLPEIARRTGYPYYNVELQLLSKYPILEPSGADGLYALLEVRPGYVVAFFNTHLDYVAYGPRLLASGMPVPDVLASEDEVRTSSMRILLPDLKELAAAGYPTFLTGDFNEPSSLDYTHDTVGMHAGVHEAVSWPVSKALLDIDFRDSYREIHPDPAAVPGNTWGNLNGEQHIAADRIDYVYSGGPVEATASRLVGEQGGPDVDIGFRRWTSDHRAVVSTFDLSPVETPTTVSLDTRMLTRGDTLTVRYNSVTTSPATITVRRGGDGQANETPQDNAGGEDGVVTQRQVTGDSGTLTFPTRRFAPGGYEVAMDAADGSEIAQNEFWVRSRHPDVVLSCDRSAYAVNEPVTVTWDDGPANRWDWVAVYRAEAADPHKDPYLLWGYTGGHNSGALPPTVSGSITFDASSQGKLWPLPPGKYVVRYLLTDQYQSVGRATFTVKR
jgi:endonuclease/exonuclease/phosphatase family metal-dependent hydrolase